MAIQIASALTEIMQRAELSADRNLIVGISGIDGSGKSTFATQINQRLASEGLTSTKIDLDDFLQPKNIRHSRDDQILGYFEDNFDYQSLIEHVLVPARTTTTFQATVTVLNLDTDQLSERSFEFIGPGILIIEGVFLFRQELREYFDFKIWLEIDFEAAMERVLSRSRDQRYGNENAIRSRYAQRFFPTQRFHMQRDDPASVADMLLNVSAMT